MGRSIKTKIKLSEVYFDEELYPRSHYNWQTGYDYSQSILSGAKFPPIVLAINKGKKCLVDGKHRFEAHKLLKKEEIDAIVYVGWNREKIFKEAIKANIIHGRSLSPYEKRRIAVKLMEMNCNEDEVSDLIQVPKDKLKHFIGQRLVNTITGEPIDSEENERLAREIGQTILKSGIKHFAGSSMEGNEITQLENSQKEYYMSSQISLLKQFINLLENNLLDKKNKNVQKLIKKIKVLLKGN